MFRYVLLLSVYAHWSIKFIAGMHYERTSYLGSGKLCEVISLKLLIEKILCVKLLIALNHGVNQKQLMLLCYIIYPCCLHLIAFYCR